MPLLGRKKVDGAIEDLYTKTNDNLRGVWIAGLVNVVQETPADEGRTRNNWFLSVSTPSSAITTSKAKGLGAIRQLSKMPKRVLNRKIFYTNNRSNILKLEYGGFTKKPETEKTIAGFSKQAPGGFVRKILILMQNKIRALN